jgi:hypothetical protein
MPAMRRRSGVSGTRPNADSCGCALAAVFLAVGFVGSGAWYGWQWASAAMSLGGGMWRVLLASFAAAIIGKIIGLARFRITAARPPSGITGGERVSSSARIVGIGAAIGNGFE